MIPNAETLPKLNLNGGSLSNTRSALKWCLNNKLMNHISPTRTTMSMELILEPPPGGNLDIKLDKVDTNHWEINHNLAFILLKRENLPVAKYFSLWIYSDKDISFQNLVLFGYIVIKVSVTKTVFSLDI